jgi:transcriptional regulator with XRE-family HTH domain
MRDEREIDRARQALARCFATVRGWSQTQLAKASGMTQSAVARFEAGGTVPTLAVLERLAAALDVSLKVGFEPRGEAA